MENGGKHAELIWHRRSGKDDISMHWAAVAAHQKVATYWHMLPQASQARKAIWEAVNPHTGIKRIDEAFPLALRETTRENEMLIQFKNGSTWQVLGSDNYNAMVGSPPAGIVYSEWALANPEARAYLRPIILENKGWQIFITTPRGKNHAYRTFESAKKKQGAFAQLLSVKDTNIFTKEQIADERNEYISDFGEDIGNALFEQEYYVSFEAAIVGAVYGAQVRKLKEENRLTRVSHDPNFKVNIALDIGFNDAFSMWFYQIIGNEIHVIDFYEATGETIEHYVQQMMGKKLDFIHDISGKLLRIVEKGDALEARHRQAYQYDAIWLPHDAKAKTFSSGGKSVQEQFAAIFGWEMIKIVPSLSLQDGIQALRRLFERMYFDEGRCGDGVDTVSQYRYSLDEKSKQFSKTPLHDWTSHASDALRYLAVSLKNLIQEIPKPKGPKLQSEVTLNDLWAMQKRPRSTGFSL